MFHDYSTLRFSGKVSEIDKIALEKLNQMLQKKQFEGFEKAVISFSKEGYIDIEMEDYYRAFYGHEEFAKELSKVIKKGYVQLEFTGEDGETWGYIIKNGKTYKAKSKLIIIEPIL